VFSDLTFFIITNSSFKFNFPEPEYLGVHGPLLQLSNIEFGYDSKILFSNVSMNINLESRIVILGPNGIGKSSLLQIINGNLNPMKGEVYRYRNLQIGYFAQHFVEQLDLSLTPLQHLLKLFPDQREDKLRGHLSSYGLSGKLAVQQILTLSGGQKARLIFATITWKKPHILLLDEPTNHLDMNTIDALLEAIKNFKGGVVIVSHDQHMIENLQPQLWSVDKGRLIRYEDTLKNYVKKLVKTSSIEI